MEEAEDDKCKEVEDVSTPTITWVYQATGSPPTSASKPESNNNTNSSDNTSNPSPTVVEVK